MHDIKPSTDKETMNVPLVLVIINDTANRNLAAEVLEYAGYQVVEASTAAEGLRMVRQHQPSTIVLDVFWLADFDGMQLMRVLHNHPETRHIPIIAFASKYDWDELNGAGFAALIDNPIDIDELSQVIKEVAGDVRIAARERG